MKPALTKEEWGQNQFLRGGSDNVVVWRETPGRTLPGGITLDLQHSGAPSLPSPETRHVIAALCLHGQPFGFTREDVQYLREIAAAVERAVTFGDLLVELKTLEHERGASIADRLEALLPPE